MSQHEDVRSEDGGSPSDRISELEQRIARIEEQLGIPSTSESVPFPGMSVRQDEAAAPEAGGAAPATAADTLEQKIGEFGFAWIGALVALLGIVFGVSYAFSVGYPAIGIAIGYVVAAGLLVLSRIWEGSFPYKSRLMLYDSMLLLFYATVRLHYFTESPLLQSGAIAILLLLAVVGYLLYQALRRQARLMAGIALFLGLVAALIADATHLSLSIIAAVALSAVVLAHRRGWWGLLIGTVVGCYLSLLIWIVGNPVMGHAISPAAQSPAALVYALVCATLFSWPTLVRGGRSDQEFGYIVMVLLNMLGATFMTGMTVVVHYQAGYAVVFTALAALLLALASTQWIRTGRSITPPVYACFGFMSLSIALYGHAGVPGAYLWLALQSLLVVSMALWFRSRLLVVANSLIYAVILLAYLVASPKTDTINFSFAIVALASARVMNWQKERLTLQTELLRNLYLFFSLIFVAFALYGAVPRQYVTISWAAAAAAYFGVSFLLRNIKYRWMGIITLLWTVAYLLLVDLARLGPGYRIAAFLCLGLVAVLVSLFYTRFRDFLTGA